MIPNNAPSLNKQAKDPTKSNFSRLKSVAVTMDEQSWYLRGSININNAAFGVIVLLFLLLVAARSLNELLIDFNRKCSRP